MMLRVKAFSTHFSIFRGLASNSAELPNVVVVGGGLMGAGIAQVAAQSGRNVAVLDLNESTLKCAESNIRGSVHLIAKKKHGDRKDNAEAFIRDTLSKIQFIEGIQKAKSVISVADIIIEAVPEKLELKQSLFAKLNNLAKSECIFATNTSSLTVTEIMQPVSERIDRCGGLHFFSPVPLMKLVEVVVLPETSKDTRNRLMHFCKDIGKTPVQCKDTPGFIVNRLLIPYTVQAISMYERGDATKEDIDTAMKLGAGYTIGPLELTDFVGLDVAKFIMDGWASRFKDDPVLSINSKLIDKLVSENKLGRKTGEGFYKYKKSS